jgi:hypothetical protein
MGVVGMETLMSRLIARLSAALMGLLIGVVVAPCGCTSTGIAIKEQFGYAKREQLVDKVQSARDSQTEAKKQFESALAEFIAVTGAQTGELEGQYKKLKSAYEHSETKAGAVSGRIRDVERVADALFSEWQAELKQYSSDQLRRASEQQLSETRTRYQQLLAAMKQAEGKMQPVLAAFKDQVLFLKHNLNARAIASLQTTVGQIQAEVTGLVKEMEASIAEANRFIDQMQGPAQ